MGGWAVSDLDALRAEVMEMRDAATRYLGLAPGDLSAQVSRNCCDVFLNLIDKHTQEGE